MTKLVPNYPIYVPTKGRHDPCHTALFLSEAGLPFFLVVEPQDYENYIIHHGQRKGATILTMHEDNQGVSYVRNFCKDHSLSQGDYRHWQLDDNIRDIHRWNRGYRIIMSPGIALHAVETFVDRYENVALAGLNYEMFGTGKQPPFVLNCRIYSCTLVLNELPNRWRLLANDDTDMCLQVLADGWCTVLFNAFLIKKIRTMTIKGGMDYQKKEDGRLKMAKTLERQWPGVVETKRRFRRPQHVVKGVWRKFDTPLKLKPGIDLKALPKVDNMGMTIVPVKEVKNKDLRKFVKEEGERLKQDGPESD